MNNNTVTHFSNLLTWNYGLEEEALLNSILKFRNASSISRVKLSIKKTGDISLQERFKALPDAVQTRIAIAPSTLWHINTVSVQRVLRGHLESSISSEELRLNSYNGKIENREVWTALGDVCFSISACKKTISQPTFCGTVIDACSPHSVAEITASDFKENFGSLVKFSDKEFEENLQKISGSLSMIEQSSSSVALLLKTVMRSIIPRKDNSNTAYKGSSNIQANGRMILFNPHIKEVCMTTVTNSVVHEAIHMLIYSLEERGALFRDTEFAKNSRIESPWSGVSLSLRAYFHAVCVWYGLSEFWKSQFCNNDFNPTLREHFSALASKGLRNNIALNKLAVFKHQLSDEAICIMEQLYA